MASSSMMRIQSQELSAIFSRPNANPPAPPRFSEDERQKSRLRRGSCKARGKLIQIFPGSIRTAVVNHADLKKGKTLSEDAGETLFQKRFPVVSDDDCSEFKGISSWLGNNRRNRPGEAVLPLIINDLQGDVKQPGARCAGAGNVLESIVTVGTINTEQDKQTCYFAKQERLGGQRAQREKKLYLQSDLPGADAADALYHCALYFTDFGAGGDRHSELHKLCGSVFCHTAALGTAS